MSINVVTMSGNLTKAPEIKATASGMPVVTFSIAVNEWRPGKNGEPGKEVTSFFDWVAFGERWEKLAGYLEKGSLVTLTGKANVDSWTNKEGKTTRKVNFFVNDIQLPKKKTDTEYYGDKSRNDTGSGMQQLQATIPSTPEIQVYDDDIPF